MLDVNLFIQNKQEQTNYIHIYSHMNTYHLNKNNKSYVRNKMEIDSEQRFF